MRLRLFDRVRRYIRPGPGGSRSRGSTRPGPPAVGGSVVVPPAGRHRRDHVPAPDQVSASSPVSTAMTGGAGALDGGGGPAEPAPQAELPRRVRRARTGADRAGPGTGPSGSPGRPEPGTSRDRARPGRGHRAPWDQGRGRQTPGQRRGHHRDQTTRTMDTAGQAARRPPGPGPPDRGHRDRASPARDHRDQAGWTGPGPPVPGTRNHAGHAGNRASSGRERQPDREPAALELAGPELAGPELAGPGLTGLGRRDRD